MNRHSLGGIAPALRGGAMLAVYAFVLLVSATFAARADSPPGRYTVNSNGTVYDARTHLTWQAATNSGTFTQAQAVSLCAGLTTAGLSWRLPKISELMTLVDVTQFNTSIDHTAFPSTASSLFWSSTLSVANSGSAWFGNFYNGSCGDDTATNPHYVRCVH